MGSRVRPWIFPSEFHCLTVKHIQCSWSKTASFVASSWQFVGQAVLEEKTVEERWQTVANLFQNGDFWPLETDGRQRGSVIPTRGKSECGNVLWHISQSCHLKFKTVASEMQTSSWEIIVDQVKPLDQNEVLWWRPLLLGPDCFILKSPRPTMISTKQLTRTNRLIFLGSFKISGWNMFSPYYDQCHAFFLEKQVQTWGCKLMSCLVSFLG